MRGAALTVRSARRGRGIDVAEVMAWPAIAVDASSRSELALSRLREIGARHILVMRAEGPPGILCEHDVTLTLPARVGAVAAPVPVLSPRDPIDQAAEVLRATGACAAPVRVVGCRYGILTRGALIRAGASGPWRRCDSCGGHHRVSHDSTADVAFCDECLDSMRPLDFDELYVDVGVGD